MEDSLLSIPASMKPSDSKACKAETTSNLQSTSTATLTVMNTEQQPDVSELDFRFDYNGLQGGIVEYPCNTTLCFGGRD
jgi:hypothetical protein